MLRLPFITPSRLVGLDIGSSSIKLVELARTRKGYKLLKIGEVEIPPEVIVEGAIINEGQVIDALMTLFAENKVKNRYVALALGGASVIVKRISLPKYTPEELRQNLHNEVAEHVPFPLEEVTLDVSVVGEDPAEPDRMSAILAAAKREVINELLAVIVGAGLKPLVVDLAAFAVGNVFELNYPELSFEPVVLLHLGNSFTTINIVHQGKSLFVRDFPKGGYEITAEIQRTLGIPFEEAESFKRGGSEEERALIPEEVGAILRAKFQDLAMDVQKTLDYAIQNGIIENVGRVVLSGGMSLISGIDSALESQLGIPVEVLNPFRRVAVDAKKMDITPYQEKAPIFSVAFGLAMREAFDHVEAA